MTIALESPAPWLTVDDVVGLLSTLDHDAVLRARRAADLAVDEGADAELVSAALLHGVGHVPEVAARFAGMTPREAGAALCRAHGSDRMALLVGGTAEEASRLERWIDDAHGPRAEVRSLRFFAMVLRSAWRT